MSDESEAIEKAVAAPLHTRARRSHKLWQRTSEPTTMCTYTTARRLHLTPALVIFLRQQGVLQGVRIRSRWHIYTASIKEFENAENPLW